MKNILHTIAILFLINGGLFAQAPQNMTYQGIASLTDGTIIKDSEIGIMIEIYETDELKYTEEHKAKTSEFGVFSILIGEGDELFGKFGDITWSKGNHRVGVSIDPQGGTNYIFMGYSELSSVPYALYGEDGDINPVNELQALYSKVVGPNTIDIFLTQSKDSVRVSFAPGGGGGGDVLNFQNLPGLFDPFGWTEFWLVSNPLNSIFVDSDPENEYQYLNAQLVNNPADNSNSTEVSLDDKFGNKQTILIPDTDIKNEIQKLTAKIRTDIITQEKVTELKLVSKDGTKDSIIIFDTDHTNEIQHFVFDIKEGADGNYGDLALTKNAGTLPIILPDLDPKNELQALTLDYINDGSGTNGYLNVNKNSNATPVFLPDLDPYNELQDIFYEDGYLGITDGSVFELPTSPWNQPFSNSITYDGYVSIGLQLVCDGPSYFNNVTSNNNVFSKIFRTPSGDLWMDDNEIKIGDYVNISADGVIQCQTIQAEIKNFVMDHPEDPTKEIYYVSLEGPEAGAYERGTSKLVNGACFVPYSDHFGLVIEGNIPTVMLTPHSIDTYGLAVTEKTATGFWVKELKGGSGNFQFDWEVKAVRNGFEDYQVIRDKK